MAQVPATELYCLFDSDCTVTPQDLADDFALPGTQGRGFIQSRTLPAGEDTTAAAGLYTYLYRVDMQDTRAVAAQACINTVSLDVGPLVAFDYDGDGALEDAFVITQGGVGSVQPATLDQDEQTLIITFVPALCSRANNRGGESSYFIGFTSAFAPTQTEGQLAGTLRVNKSVAVQTPGYFAATTPTLRSLSTQSRPNDLLTIQGAGFAPGGYTATIRWNDEDHATFTIPRGGAFSQTIRVPATAQAGENTVTVCSFNPCATGDFTQSATTAVTVEATGNEDAVVIWHAWPIARAEMFRGSLPTNLAQNVSFRHFATEAELRDALLAGVEEQNTPDLVFGPSRWKDELVATGVVAPYCLPDGCQACQSEHPPSWCPYAKGDFTATLNPAFNLAGLCTGEGDCVPCLSENPPRWCWAAQLPPRQPIDIFQAAFAEQHEDAVYPLGIPITWDSSLVTLNGKWFSGRALITPGDVDSILEQDQEHGHFLRLIDLRVVDPIPTVLQPLVARAEKNGAFPPAEAAILLSSAQQLWALANAPVASDTPSSPPLQPLVMPLADYTPRPVVQGVYLTAQGDQRDKAFAVAMYAAGETFQTELFGESGLLPTNGAAWHNLLAESAATPVVDLGQMSAAAFLHDLIYTDFWAIQQAPVYQPPAGDPVCQAKGTALYAGYDTATDPLQQIHATYAANSFVRTCDRALRTLPLTENACRADAIEALAATLLDQWGEAAALSQARAAGLHILGTCGERSGPSGGDQEIFLPIIVR